MAELRFEWDPAKNRLNIQKHRVSFEEARSVFYDENALIMEDPEHSVAEERYLILGISSGARALVVCHCLRKAGDVIRIISARKAVSRERAQYTSRLK